MRCPYPKWVCPRYVPELVPCGKCLACLVNKRNEWAFRLEQEYKASHGACFVTLTYHPKFCPDYGLDKKHVQKYMKRLRKVCSDKLRYFLVGEYGTRTQRPHYHIILFNYGERNIETEIRQAWSSRKSEAFGIVDIRPLTAGRILYCTKYIIQRGNGEASGNNKPFMLCSRAYGIGLGYLSTEMADYHRRTQRNYTLVHGKKGRLSRYYRDKIWWPIPGGTKNPTWYECPARSNILEEAKAQGEAQELKNYQILREAGYTDPDRIQADMRSAVLGRVKQKTAYTQKF